MAPQLREHLVAEVRAPVDHARQDQGDLDGRVEAPLDEPHHLHELGHPLHGEVLRLHRDDDVTGGDERVGGQHAERGRAVEEHVVEAAGDGSIGLDLLQSLPQDHLAADTVRELGLHTRQRGVGGHHVEPFGRGVADHVLQRDLLDQAVGHRRLVRLGPPVDVQGQVRLRIDVQEQDLVPRIREGRPDVDRRGGLTDSTLLVDDRHTPHPTISLDEGVRINFGTSLTGRVRGGAHRR